MSLKIVGYITSDALDGNFIPHGMQNLMIKTFLQKLGFQHHLSWTEYKNQAPLVLKSLLVENFYQGICFFSLAQISSLNSCKELLDLMSQRNLWIGFALEGEFFNDQESLEKITTLIKIKQMIQNAPHESN